MADSEIQVRKNKKVFIERESLTIMSNQKSLDELITLSASQTRTVLSNELVARSGNLGPNRTLVIKAECSWILAFGSKVSVHHNATCVENFNQKSQAIMKQ